MFAKFIGKYEKTIGLTPETTYYLEFENESHRDGGILVKFPGRYINPQSLAQPLQIPYADFEAFTANWEIV